MQLLDSKKIDVVMRANDFNMGPMNCKADGLKISRLEIVNQIFDVLELGSESD